MDSKVAMNSAYAQFQLAEKVQEQQQARVAFRGFIIGVPLLAMSIFLLAKGTEIFPEWFALVAIAMFLGAVGTAFWGINAYTGIADPSNSIWKPAVNTYLKDCGVTDLSPSLEGFRPPMQFHPRLGSYPLDSTLLYSGTARNSKAQTVPLVIKITDNGVQVASNGYEVAS